MSYEKRLQDRELIIGTKQTTRALELSKVDEVFIARDADPRITSKIVNLCKKMEIQLTYVDTMKQLGKACGIEVGAAMVAVLKE